MTPTAELRARVLEAAHREPAPTRPQLRARNAALLVSAVLVPVGVFVAYGALRSAPRPPQLIAETAGAAGAIALVALFVALGRGRSMLGRAGIVLLGLAVLTPLVLLAAKVGISAQYADMMEKWPTRPGFRCFRLSSLMVAWPLVAIILTRRGTDPVHPVLAGAAIGASLGASVWVLVDLWCPVAYVPHLLLGHVLPLVLATVVGALLARRLLAVRAR